MCTEHSIKALSSSKLNWIKRITKIDEEIGIIKTGDFDKENKIGFRVRVAIRNKEINIAVKGYGLYFNDLGVSQAINDFRVHLNECLR